jgi:hypothetical protein
MASAAAAAACGERFTVVVEAAEAAEGRRHTFTCLACGFIAREADRTWPYGHVRWRHADTKLQLQREGPPKKRPPPRSAGASAEGSGETKRPRAPSGAQVS